MEWDVHYIYYVDNCNLVYICTGARHLMLLWFQARKCGIYLFVPFIVCFLALIPLAFNELCNIHCGTGLSLLYVWHTVFSTELSSNSRI